MNPGLEEICYVRPYEGYAGYFKKLLLDFISDNR